MHAVEYNLKKLLFDYDCVTIPGLGGFIMQAKSSWINESKNRISPPSRIPSFNILLDHDDGLLISAIANAEHISYMNASVLVRDYVNEFKKNLELGEKIKIQGIGEFSSTDENGLLFRLAEPANFFAASFGMESIILNPVIRPRDPVRIMKKPVDRRQRADMAKKPASVKWTLGLTIPVIIVLLYGIIFPNSIQDIYTNYSGFVIDLFQESPNTSPVVDPVLTNPTTAAEINIEVLSVEAEEPLVEVVEEFIPPASEPGPEFHTSTKYYIIGGCFENEVNAGNFLQDLRKRGFDAEEAGTNKRGHQRISYKSFPDIPAALSYLDKIRLEENASAWLLKY